MKSARQVEGQRARRKGNRGPDAVPRRATPLKARRSTPADTGAKIRILIAEDHPIFRHGLRTLLELQSDFAVIGEATDGAEAVRLTNQLKPDVLLLDFSMPRLSALEVIRDLNGAAAGVRTIVLMAAIVKPDIIKVLQLGARGVLLRESPTDVLLKSIRSVFGGGLWIGREIMRDVVQVLAALRRSTRPTAPRNFRLTGRERETLRLIVEGNANKGIAQKLSVSEDTVKHHLTSIFDKTGVSSRLELALFAIHHRLIKRVAG